MKKISLVPLIVILGFSTGAFAGDIPGPARGTWFCSGSTISNTARGFVYQAMDKLYQDQVGPKSKNDLDFGRFDMYSISGSDLTDSFLSKYMDPIAQSHGFKNVPLYPASIFASAKGAPYFKWVKVRVAETLGSYNCDHYHVTSLSEAFGGK
ncbi:MAG: hypothetical protein ACXVA9_08245 [Bdellovibrionales bacterium]